MTTPVDEATALYWHRVTPDDEQQIVDELDREMVRSLVKASVGGVLGIGALAVTLRRLRA